MKMLKKLIIAAVAIPCLCGWLLLVQAHGASRDAQASTGHGLNCHTSCPPTPTPPPGG